MTDRVPTLPVPCGQCGAMHDMPGRWAYVGYSLSSRGAVYLYFRCPTCNSVAYNPDLEAPFGVYEFFQVIQPPIVGGGKKLLERVTYNIADLPSLLAGGQDSPLTRLEDDMGKGFAGYPGSDLTCGICAPEGILPVRDVNAAIAAVNSTYPA